MDPISEALRQHYSAKFSAHGPSSEGVDWGPDESKMLLRYAKMLNVLGSGTLSKPSLLDVGCGYGGLLIHALANRIALDYAGIDVAENMIEWAAAHLPSGRFVHGSILSHCFDTDFDYVVCSGILTQKLEALRSDMDQFAAQLIRTIFPACKYGIAFNVMTTEANYFAKNLYYRNPAELLSWCLSEITPHIRVDHAYPLYEYTLYLYRGPVK